MHRIREEIKLRDCHTPNFDQLEIFIRILKSLFVFLNSQNLCFVFR